VPGSVTSAVSYHLDPTLAAAELAQTLQNNHVGFVLFFCSADYDLPALAAALNHALDGIPLAGCTTAGEITDRGYDQRCITAIGFDNRWFAVEGVLLTELEEVSLSMAQEQVSQLLERCRVRQVAPIKGHSFALTLLDGLSVREEQVLAALGAALGSVPQFGGSAADRLDQGQATHVFFNGHFHTDAAVLLLFNTRCDFKVFSSHHLVPTSEKLVVTEASDEGRDVKELNAMPAADLYGQIIHKRPELMDPAIFALNPLAVRLGDQSYVRAIRHVNPDRSLSFFAAVETGVVLTRMRRGDMRQHLLQMLQQIEREVGPPQLIIGCDCILRRLEAEVTGVLPQLSQLLQRFRVVGFNTYGEHYSGVHINQTFTGVAIGQIPND